MDSDKTPIVLWKIMKYVQERLVVTEFDSQPADRLWVHISNCLWAALSKNPNMIRNNVYKNMYDSLGVTGLKRLLNQETPCGEAAK